MLIAMSAWVLRFGFFDWEIPAMESGCLSSMLVYGVASSISSTFRDRSLWIRRPRTPVPAPRNVHADDQRRWCHHRYVVGAVCCKSIYVGRMPEGQSKSLMLGDWQSVWFIFAGYALLVTICLPSCFVTT